MAPDAERPDCRRCRAYFVTYDPGHPHGCRTFGLKSRELPAAAVRLHSGSECRAFAPRRPPAAPPPGPGGRRAGGG